MLYSPTSCDLLCGCSGDEVYRLNLEEGRFKSGEWWSRSVKSGAALPTEQPCQRPVPSLPAPGFD